MAELTVLMVAEKPSLALAIATHLCGGVEVHTRSTAPRRSTSFRAAFAGRVPFSRDGQGPRVQPRFSARVPVVGGLRARRSSTPALKSPTSGAVAGHVQREARGCSHLVLWLDCDREGENICFEVMHLAVPSLSSAGGRQVWRARFSAVSEVAVRRAMETLAEPNEAEASAVDARQELDLKVGVAFTRFQTRHFHERHRRLDGSTISYGPCQTPTLGFVVQRHVEILSFVSDPFWKIELALLAGGGAHAGEQFDVAGRRERLFDQKATAVLCKLVAAAKRAAVAEVVQAEETLRRPEGLNTVTLLKVASAALGLGAQHTMRVAESLHGRLHPYPRTGRPRTRPALTLPPRCAIGSSTPSGASMLPGCWTATWCGRAASTRATTRRSRRCARRRACRAAPTVGGCTVHRQAVLASLCPDAKLATTKATFEAAGERFARAGARSSTRGGSRCCRTARRRRWRCRRWRWATKFPRLQSASSSRARRRRRSRSGGGLIGGHGGARHRHRRLDPAAHWEHRGAAVREDGAGAPPRRRRSASRSSRL